MNNGNMVLVEDKMYRTLLRVFKVEDDRVLVVVPAWDSEQLVAIRLENVPTALWPKFVPGFRFFAKAAIGLGQDEVGKMKFADFEVI